MPALLTLSRDQGLLLDPRASRVLQAPGSPGQILPLTSEPFSDNVVGELGLEPEY